MSKFYRDLRNSLYMPLVEKLVGRRIQEKITDLYDWHQSPAAEKRHRYIDALAKTVIYAGSHVPYYRDLFRRINFQPEKLRRDIAWLNDVPHLTKEIVMMQPERLLSDEFDPRTLIERKTSGSTGLTLSFFYSGAELDLASAVLRYLDLATGKTLTEREVQLRLLPPDGNVTAWQSRAADLFKNFVLNRRTIEFTELNQLESRRQLNALRESKPYSIYALRSTFESLLRLADSSDLCRGLCKIYINTGETLEKHSADFITNKVGCRVINRYGNAEFGAVAQSEADTQTLRFVDGLVWPENFIVEGMSEIVLTTLYGRAMPLIRYRTGDLGEVVDDGQGGFSLNNVTGRLHDLVHVGERTYTTAYFADFLQKRFSVHDFQVAEGQGDRPTEFRVVTDHPDELGGIATELRELLGQPVSVVRIRLSDLIRRGRQMKFSHVVRSDLQ